MYNAEMINMTMDELVETGGGAGGCFWAGAFGVFAGYAVATGNLPGGIIAGFAFGYFTRECIAQP